MASCSALSSKRFRSAVRERNTLMVNRGSSVDTALSMSATLDFISETGDSGGVGASSLTSALLFASFISTSAMSNVLDERSLQQVYASTRRVTVYGMLAVI